VLEARIIVRAWREAVSHAGEFRLRILTSEETYRSNDDILAALPADVAVTYYHSLLTYHAGRRSIFWGPGLDAAPTQRNMLVCPSLVASVGLCQPFTGPQFIKFRMEEFLGKGLHGFLGYATPRTQLMRFNIEAAAEWAWNVDGRTPTEFARSWALREHMSDPDALAQWVETLGPVSWAVYGSEFPAGVRRRVPGDPALLLRDGKLPELGSIKWGLYAFPWGDIKKPEELRKHVEAAEEARHLADRVGEAWVIAETRVVAGYVRALNALWELQQVVGPDGITDGAEAGARKWAREYCRGLRDAAGALAVWEQGISGQEAQFTQRSSDIAADMAEAMEQALGELGLELDGDG
jgi:hypothetical protein